MTTVRILALFVSTMAMLAIGPVPSRAQSAPATSETDSVSIHVSLQKSSYTVGEKPFAVLAIKNTGSEPIWFSDALYLERFHVTTKDGEPPKTGLHRHLLGDFRPGDGPGLLSGPVAGRAIAPGTVYSHSYDLTYFYDLSKPGNYSVYLELYDPAGPKDGSGQWLRTNTAQFEMVASSQ
jgi:hypothetical protein